MRKILSITAFLILISCESSFAGYLCSFSGKLNLKEKTGEVSVPFKDKGLIIGRYKEDSKGKYSFLLSLDHASFSLFELSSEIFANIIAEEKGNFKGEIKSRYSLLNFKPIKELRGEFSIEDNKFYLKDFSFANISGAGFLSLEEPYKLEVALNLESVDINDLIDIALPDNNSFSVGELFGKIKATGNIKSLFLQGRVQSRNGFIKNLNYDELTLNLEGLFPNVRVVDSKITGTDGLKFSLQGSLDLSSEKSLAQQIKAFHFLPLVKKSDSEVEWTIKSNKEDDSLTELKYFRRKSLYSGEEEMDMFGLGRTIKF
ncbi:MAG: hypothetical protein HQL27_06510 [Candidatus Omnitrophica bacterium]|nr:hypothetical protein [Candidatus Omnitrophota bacterium]